MKFIEIKLFNYMKFKNNYIFRSDFYPMLND